MIYKTFLTFLLALAASSVAAEPNQTSIEGIYLAKDKDHKIELFLSGSELRGRIVWTEEPNVKDEHNENPELRSRPVVGIEHLRGLKRDSNGVWRGGELYNPEDGKSYDAKLWFNGNTLVIRGKPRIAVVGGLLGALFGRVKYERVEEDPAHATAEATENSRKH